MKATHAKKFEDELTQEEIDVFLLGKDASIQITDSWQPNLTVSEMSSRAIKEYNELVEKQTLQDKIEYVLSDLQKKVKDTDEAYKTYIGTAKYVDPKNAAKYAEYEHGERKISTKEDYTGDGLLLKKLNQYQLNKLVTAYSFSTLTKLCISQGIGKDKLKDYQSQLEAKFPNNSPEYSTYQDCYLNSTWSSFNIASTHRLNDLIHLLGALLDTTIGDAEIQILRIKHALPFNLLMKQQLDVDDFKETFANCSDKQQLVKIVLKAMDDAFKISPEKYAAFATNNVFFGDILVEHGIALDTNPSFKDILTFLVTNKILSSFEDQKHGASVALKNVFLKIMGSLANAEYIEKDLFYRIGESSDEQFAQYLKSQSTKSAKALCLWSKFFVQDSHNKTITAKPKDDIYSLYQSQQGEKKIDSSPLKNVKIDTKTNIATYEDEDDWTIMESVSQFLPKKEVKSKNAIGHSMNEDYKQIVKMLAQQSKDLKELELQHKNMLNDTDNCSFNQKFNKTFTQEISQPNIAVNQSVDNSMWLGEMIEQLGQSENIDNQGEGLIGEDMSNMLGALYE